MNREERRELSTYVRKTLKRKVKEIEFPGGKTRDSVRVILETDQSLIATKRPSDKRAKRELAVLKILKANGATVPKVYGFNGRFLLQQDLGNQRLSQMLHDEDAPLTIHQQLDAALTSMVEYQNAARAVELETKMMPIGHEIEWRRGLSNVPHELAEMIGITPPAYDADQVADLLKVTTPNFVKWDSRPGNAIVSPKGIGYWFDWEHCGVRNAADDLVWLMADEFVTYDKSMEAELFAKHMESFAIGRSVEETERYVRVLGVFHSCVRLQLVFDNKGDGDWWSLTKCLNGDKVGVVRRCCRRLVWRAAAWADHDPVTRPLVPWFQQIEEYFEAL